MANGIFRFRLGLCLLALLCSGAVAQNLVENGSFETPLAQEVAWPGYFVGTGVEIPGWTAQGNYGLNNNRTDSPDDGQRNPFLGAGRPIPDGDQVLFVQNPDGSTNRFRIQQFIEGLEDGEWYQLIFYTAVRPNLPPWWMRARIGTENLNLTRSGTPWDWYVPVTANIGTEPFERHEYLFQWDSELLGTPRFRIQFEVQEEGDSAILFDNIQIRKVNLDVTISGPSIAEFGGNVVLTAKMTGAYENDEIFETSSTQITYEGATFQWYRNGVLLAGETNSTLVLLDVTPDDSAEYSVFVSANDRTAEASLQLMVASGLPISNTYVLLVLCALLMLVATIHFTRKGLHE